MDLRSSGFPKNDSPVVIYPFVTFIYIYIYMSTRGNDMDDVGDECVRVRSVQLSRRPAHCLRDEKSFVRTRYGPWT